MHAIKCLAIRYKTNQSYRHTGRWFLDLASPNIKYIDWYNQKVFINFILKKFILVNRIALICPPGLLCWACNNNVLAVITKNILNRIRWIYGFLISIHFTLPTQEKMWVFSKTTSLTAHRIAYVYSCFSHRKINNQKKSRKTNSREKIHVNIYYVCMSCIRHAI